ncbi:MAG: glycosyltransferase family 2 protein [Lachnospiraceae bacterium]|nr:glycosyltransferase family 2 protein [Lachnospiraceae bacterium]
MAGNSGYEGKGRKEAGKAGLEKPLVSVVIPVHNGAGTLPAALDSALAQEVSVEILVIDDCSTDGLEAVKVKYAADPRILWKKNQEKLGAAKSRNKGVKEARGNYVAFLDSDDYWAPGKLKKQLARMEQDRCVLCSTARELMTPEGKLTGKIIGVKPRITYRDLLRHNSINCSSVLLLRRVALEFPMEHEDSHEDYITWLRILKKYGFAAGIDEPLLKYRLSNSGKSGSKAKSAAMTLRVYRYLGFGWGKSLRCFVSYALHGVGKYLLAGFRKHAKLETEQGR